MQLNHQALRDFTERKGWNISRLARKLGMDYSHVYRVMHEQRGVGLKFLDNFYRLCKKEGLDFRDFLSN